MYKGRIEPSTVFLKRWSELCTLSGSDQHLFREPGASPGRLPATGALGKPYHPYPILPHFHCLPLGRPCEGERQDKNLAPHLTRHPKTLLTGGGRGEGHKFSALSQQKYFVLPSSLCLRGAQIACVMNSDVLLPPPTKNL